jgi:hypothetical protein
MNPTELKAAYERGENIIALLRKKFGSPINTEEFIEISYDLQAGSYISAMENSVNAAKVQNYAGEIARILRKYGAPTSLLEAGVGEATTMAWVLNQSRSQDLPQAWQDAGQFYWGRRATFLSVRSLFSTRAYPVRLPRLFVQDIDTEEDWEVAEAVFKALQRSRTNP